MGLLHDERSRFNTVTKFPVPMCDSGALRGTLCETSCGKRHSTSQTVLGVGMNLMDL
jgi:hypothetical protein